MNLNERRLQIKYLLDAVAADDPRKTQQVSSVANPVLNAVPLAINIGDQSALELLKPQTTVSLAKTETDETETDETETDETEGAQQIFVSRYQPGDVERAGVHRQPGRYLVDIETPELTDEALVFLDLDLRAHAKYASRVSPTILAMAEDFDSFVLCKTELLTDSELELISETVAQIRQFNKQLPLFYLHKAAATQSPEADTAIYEANVEKLHTFDENVSSFYCETLDPAADTGYQEFRAEWRKIADAQREVLVSELWPNLLASLTSLKQEYQDFIKKIDATPGFQAKLDAYHRICEEHPTENFTWAWEDVNLESTALVSKAFSGNNGDTTLYDISIKDLPDSASSAEWDRWHISKNNEVLKAFLEFIRVIEGFFYDEYKRVATENIDAMFKKLADAGLTSDLSPTALSEIRARFQEDLHLRELSPDLTNIVEAVFRYGFMAYLLGSLTVSTVSGIALFWAAWKGGSELAAIAAPLGPIAATLAFAGGAGGGIFVADKMIENNNKKQWKAEATKELSRLMDALKTEAFSTRVDLWTKYNRLLGKENNRLHTAVKELLTNESKVLKELNDATPEELEALRSQKLAVIETLDAVLASEEPASEEPPDDDKQDKSA